jgi:Beta-propeller repeat./Hemolysin-type calcium-binding repeat (2 copies).
LIYSTYLGGSGDDNGNRITVDSANNVYVTGDTTSTNFPTKNAIQSVSGGGKDAFVTSINSSGSASIDSTYLGGIGDADLGSNSPNRIIGTDGDDILTGDSENNVLMGMRGNDSLDGGLGNDIIFGGKGSDTLLGSSGDDTLFGNRGADSLNGGDGNDILLGGKGDDLLIGGLGDDSLIGGNGSDRFLLSTNSGIDTILDFEDGKDLLTLANHLTFSQLSITQENSSTLIRLSATSEILASLNGVSASLINVADFNLA